MPISSILPNFCIQAIATPQITDEIIEHRIDELYTLLNGKYFNVNQDTSCGVKSSGHGCSYCNTANIINSQWFINMFGTIKNSQLVSTGSSCVGFAWFAGWYIFKADNNDSIRRSVIGTYDFTYDSVMKYAHIGDYFRLNGHSVIFINADSSGITVLDCNWGAAGTGYNCIVQKHKISYNWANTFTISRMHSVTSGNSNMSITPTYASTLSINPSNYPAGILDQGESFPLSGQITSNYIINSVKGEVINNKNGQVTLYASQAASTKSFPIRGSKVDMNLQFSTLLPGTYYLKYTAADLSGKIITWSSDPFTVVGEYEAVKHTTRTTQLNLRGLESTSNLDEGWSWDKENKTLILDNVNFEVADEPSALITESATIVLKGESIIKSTYNGNDTYITCGIYAVNGELKFRGEGNITVIGGISKGNSFGIAAGLGSRGSLTVDGAGVTAIGGISNSFGSTGIRTPRISVNSGSLIAMGGTGNSDSRGLHIYGGTLNINGGKLLASGGSVDHATLPGANAGIYLGEGSTMTLGANVNLTDPINGYIAEIDSRNRASTILDSSDTPAQKVTIQAH